MQVQSPLSSICFQCTHNHLSKSVYTQMFFPEPSHPRRHIYPGLLNVYTKGGSLCEVTWRCAFPLYVFIFSTPLSSCPSVKTFVGSLLCSRHSAGSEDQGVKQTYGIPLLKEFISEWPEKRPQDISLNRFWAKAVKSHVAGLIMWEEMTSCWEVILGKRKPWDSYEGGVGVERQSAGLGIPKSEVSTMKKIWLSRFLLVPNYLSFWGVNFIMI